MFVAVSAAVGARPPPDAMREGAVLPLRPSNSSRRNARFAGRLRKESQNKKLELSTQKTLVHPTRRVVPAPARRPFGALDAAASVSPAAVRTQPAASSQQPAASSQAASSLARRRELDERHVVFANGPRPGPCRQQHATPRQLTVAKRRLSLSIIRIAAASRWLAVTGGSRQVLLARHVADAHFRASGQPELRSAQPGRFQRLAVGTAPERAEHEKSTSAP